MSRRDGQPRAFSFAWGDGILSKAPQVERRKIADLTPDPSNANVGTERGLSMLDDSLSVVGLGRSIVTDKNGVIIGGNKTTERAIDRGFEDALIVHTTGKELVVVHRDDLDLSSNDPNNPARRLAYYDNRVAQIDLTWNAEQLLADVNAGFDFEHLFSDGELDSLLADVRSPDFMPVDESDQPRLDQKAPIICPHCGKEFIPE